MTALRTAALLLSALAAGHAGAQAVLIKGARVHTAGSAGTLGNADVLVLDGRVAEVGSGLAAPEGATVVEAGGKPLTPGLFGGLTQIGVEEVNQEARTYDAELKFEQPAWQHLWRPEFDVTRAFNPRSILLPIARVEGVTWGVVSPLPVDSLVVGQGAAVTLDGRFDAKLPGSESLFVNWGSKGHDAAGGSRAAEYMLFDQAIREAREGGPVGPASLLLPEGRAVLKRYLGGGRVAFFVQRASDIRAVVRYAREHGMKPVVVGGDEAWVVAKELAEADVPVILNALDNLPTDFDRLGSRYDNAKLLHEAGVRVAISYTDESFQVRKNRQLAGNAVAHGLPWEAALEAVTSVPAEIFGIGKDHGRIEKGQSADLVLWSGDPLEVTSVAEQVWIAGRPVEMRSRQTALRDKYVERVKAGNAR